MSVPNLWRTKKQRYSLQASVCTECAHVMFPPRGVCPHCSATQSHELSGEAPARSDNGHNPQPVTFAMPVPSEPVAIAAAGDD